MNNLPSWVLWTVALEYIATAFFTMRFVKRLYDPHLVWVFLIGMIWPIWMPFDMVAVILWKIFYKR